MNQIPFDSRFREGIDEGTPYSQRDINMVYLLQFMRLTPTERLQIIESIVAVMGADSRFRGIEECPPELAELT
jgi:hypothetical protein